MSGILPLSMLLVLCNGILSESNILTSSENVQQESNDNREYMPKSQNNEKILLDNADQSDTRSGGDPGIIFDSGKLLPAHTEVSAEITTLKIPIVSNEKSIPDLFSGSLNKIEKSSMKEIENNKKIEGPTNSKSNGFAMSISAEVVEINIQKNPKGCIRSDTIHSTPCIDTTNDGADTHSDEPGLEGTRLTTSLPDTGDDIITEENVTPMDPIDEEIKNALDSLPKLPELSFSDDNNTRFIFHKDPAEAALDDRITQIARQLAEIGLRREYEEKKLGHYIPIRLKQFDEGTHLDLDTSFTKTNTGKSFKSPSDFLVELGQPSIPYKPMPVPQYIYNSPDLMSGKVPEAALKQLPTDVPNSSEHPLKIGHEENPKPDVNSEGQTPDLATILQQETRRSHHLGNNGLFPQKTPILHDMIPPETIQNQNYFKVFAYKES